MKKVAIVTDSTAYLPQEIVDELGLTIVPLTLHWDGESYRDGVDIMAEEFYERLAQSETIPTTSQTTVGEFVKIFQSLLDQDYAVLTLPISSGISGTVESAFQAKKEFEGQPVEVVDTKLVSMALGFMVMTVGRAAKAGTSLEECVALAHDVYPRIGVYFTVDNLKYLHKGGRINTAKRLLGSMLNVKPLMEIRDGKIELVESVRSRKKAMSRMLDLIEEDIAGREPVRIGAFHAAADEDVNILLEMAIERFHPVETVLTFVSPVIGSHTGPGTISLAYMVG
ncbi:MAG: DegV family protein [Anaerolineaceae bacterium]|nr:DegV family protein [Anaerolineaceae bacterium]